MIIDPLLIAIVLLLLLCFVGISWFAGSDAPYVPTKVNLLPLFKLAGVKKVKIFYELGSGDGRVVLEAAKMGAESHGVEQSWLRVWYSRYLARKYQLPQAFFYHGDIFQRHYYPADIIYIFMLPKAVEKLEAILKEELKPGAIVITQTFHFQKWKPFKKIKILPNNGQEIMLGKDKKMGDFWLYKS
jgi:hypothetical protein